jgi:N-acetylneuraminate synthase
MPDAAHILSSQTPILVAEIGANHQGQGALAKQLVDLAIESGVDWSKGQIRDCEHSREIGGSVTPDWSRPYEGPQSFGLTYHEHRRALELGRDEHRSLRRYAAIRGACYGVSVWDLLSAEWWLRGEQPSWIKVPSACITDHAMLTAIAEREVVAVLSTGMSTPREIDDAVDHWVAHPERLILLHCVSAYPQQVADVHLRQMQRLAEQYAPIPVGISGHWVGIQIDVIATTLGVRLIERHITLDRSMKGSDHAASLGPDGVRRWVRDVRAVAMSYGWPRTGVYPIEVEPRRKLRGTE